jgi:hypothetical protein
LFFDAKGVSKTNDGYVRVWTKCLPEKDLDTFDEKSDRFKELADRSADKIVSGYVPPIVVIGRLEFDAVSTVTGYEETANLNDIDPNAKFFMELDCSKKMDRRLSTSVKINGKMVNDDKPTAWKYGPPETNVAYLQKILCR